MKLSTAIALPHLLLAAQASAAMAGTVLACDARAPDGTAFRHTWTVDEAASTVNGRPATRGDGYIRWEDDHGRYSINRYTGDYEIVFVRSRPDGPGRLTGTCRQAAG